MDFCEEIAKFRAARRLWAKLIKEKFGASDPRSMMLRFHTQTAGVSLTAQQPENNIVRTAIEALAAVLGGTQSLHTNSYDEALALPTEQSAKIALRTQQIIGHESGVTNTVDPVAGSFYIEHLTDEIQQRAEEYLERIETLGGAQRAIETGYVNREIQESAWQFQKAVDEGERTVVGVNKYTSDREIKVRIARPDPTAQQEQQAELRALRETRDGTRWRDSLQELERDARGNANLMPALLNCVESYATVGEISDTLRRVFGEYKGNAAF
jgi:methylmalonyl-CoA mutase N-terminal domain/subunit